MQRSLLILAPAAVLLIGARLAVAQPPAPPSFEQIDADKNGSLSKDEVAKFFEQRRAAGGGGGGGGAFDPSQVFARWDTNGDGSISKAEFDARPRPGGGGGGGGPRPPQ